MSDFLSTLEKFHVQFMRQKVNENLSEHTIRSYNVMFKYFFGYLNMTAVASGEDIKPEDINEDFLYEFLDYLSSLRSGIKASTKKQYIIRIKVFLRFITKKSKREFDFISMLEEIKIKVPKTERKFLSAEERHKIADYLDKLDSATDSKSIQKALIAKLLLFTGIRACEIRALKTSDFISDGEGAYNFKVFGKGRKEAWMYIKEDLIKRELESIPFQYVCETKLGKPMTHYWLWHTMKNIYTEAGVDETGVHICRHTFAKVLVDNGVTLTTIKELLRHSSVAVTQLYAHSDESAKKRAVMGVF